MDKKEVYEHLAKIYLDASLKKKKQNKKYPAINNLLVVVLAFVLGFSLFSLYTTKKSQLKNSQFALLLQPGTAKINFNFDPACKEIYSINLNKLNAARFKAIGFSVKKTNYADTVSLRVEFTNSFREKSEIYLNNISNKWQEYKLPLAAFKQIRDWTEMSNLSFIVEEWNTNTKDGVVLIDNLGFVR